MVRKVMLKDSVTMCNAEGKPRTKGDESAVKKDGHPQTNQEAT